MGLGSSTITDTISARIESTLTFGCNLPKLKEQLEPHPHLSLIRDTVASETENHSQDT